jgi:protein-glutamine gamma-glutamyltransferase
MQDKIDSEQILFSDKGASYNPEYWEEVVGDDGSIYWKVRDDQYESDALADVFDPEGGSYEIECAAAINLIILKSRLDTIGDDMFCKFYYDLMINSIAGWEYFIRPFGTHQVKDDSLEYKTGDAYTDGDLNSLEVGDYVYFKNPGVEDSSAQGENALYLGKYTNGDPMFFGLNLGIFTPEDVYGYQMTVYGYLSSVRGTIEPSYLKAMAELAYD